MTEILICFCDPPRQLIRHDGWWYHIDHQCRLSEPCPDEGGYDLAQVELSALPYKRVSLTEPHG